MTLGPLMIDVAGTALSAEDRELLRHPAVGSVILFSRNFEDPAQLQALVAEIHGLRSPALLVAVDQEGGRVQRFRNGLTALPALRHIGRGFDVAPALALAQARSHAWLMAAELLACGVDFSLSPCVDLDYGLSTVIGDRALHSRAAAVGQLAVAYMHGMRDAGMAATAKHFPGHGAVVGDSHLSLPVDRRQYADMEADLRPYRLLIENGLPAVMVAHVQYPDVDAVPASFSRRWIGGVLRADLRFQGLVIADDLSMSGAAAMGDLVERVQRALAAGCELLPVCNARVQVTEVLEELRFEPDPALHLKLARMRGRPHFETARLRESAQWQLASLAVAEIDAPQELRLKGASA